MHGVRLVVMHPHLANFFLTHCQQHCPLGEHVIMIILDIAFVSPLLPAASLMVPFLTPKHVCVVQHYATKMFQVRTATPTPVPKDLPTTAKILMHRRPI